MAYPLSFRTRIKLRSTGLALLVSALMLPWAAGCREATEIREYTVEKPPLPQATHRMLAVIVPQENVSDDPTAAESGDGDEEKGDASAKSKQESPPPEAWFFKLVGPIEQVEKAASAFDQFVASIRTGKGRPEWTLPEGWREEAAGRSAEFGREATIRIGEGSSSLELAVSKLPMDAERRESWTLRNINRWRGQLQMPAIARSELEEFTDEIKAGEETAIKVDLRGALKAAGPPMAGMLADAREAHQRAGVPDAASRSKAPSRAAEPLPFDAEVPAEWSPGRLNQFRIAAYEIKGDDGQRAAEMIVTPLGPEAGDLKGNVDRWRVEIKLPPSTPAELEEQTKKIEIDGQTADYVHLAGPEDARPREATLGVILRRPDRVWFFKLRGEAAAVEREKERFEQYVKSVKFK